MYNVWVQCHSESDANASNQSVSDTENDSTSSSQAVSVSMCLTAIRESIASRYQYSSAQSILVSQLDILLKASEPTRTHANDLLEVLMSSEYMARDVETLERLSAGSSTRTAYGSTCGIVLAVLAESEHILTPSSVKGSFLHEKKRGGWNDASSATLDFIFDQAAVYYYTRATANHDRPNPIAMMQLGVKCLKGAGLAGPLLGKAFEWFKFAASMQNPIAQHKMGYFYDEGLPDVCAVDVMEAVKWYSQAAELMPDSMHNLAKIYEDGRCVEPLLSIVYWIMCDVMVCLCRGGFKSNIEQAVTLYSVAAARGFPLSQVNLGRLFLLGEDGVTRDREAGKRLLTLAAESGDADAQMVVGMIHATPAFECYDLLLSEHWLRQSLKGGKRDAERLLVRVSQQLAQQQALQAAEGATGVSEVREVGKPVSQDAAAAKLRGDDFRSHGLLHAAVLEYSRAFELDKRKLMYFVDRLDALAELGHSDECLTDSSLLLMCVDQHGKEHSRNVELQDEDAAGGVGGHGHGVGAGGDEVSEEEEEAEAAMSRLYDILVESLGIVFSARLFPLARPFLVASEKGDVIDSYNSIFEQVLSRVPNTAWSQTHDDKAHMSGSEKDYQRRCQQQLAEEYMANTDRHHKDPLLSRLLQECLGWSVKSVRSSAFLAR
jgi:TPR repeat protein